MARKDVNYEAPFAFEQLILSYELPREKTDLTPAATMLR